MNVLPPEIQASTAGPSPLADVLSDRAGEVLISSMDPTPVSEPAARVLAMLDSAEAPGATESPKKQSSPRREGILDAAEKLFREYGYHGASLRDISREAGISHPGMLHHFSSKNALLGGVVDRLEEHAQALLDRENEIAASLAALEAELEGEWSPRHPKVRLLATLSSESVSADHPARFRVARLRRVHEHLFEQILHAFSKRGALRDDVNPEFGARALVAMMLSLAVREETVRTLQRSTAPSAVDDLRSQVRLMLAGSPGAKS